MDYTIPNPSLYNVPFRTESFNGMPYRYLGASGLRVSNVGLGTWKIGYPETGDDSRIGEKEAFRIFDRALELGVTHWDTANRYNAASGNSERIIGKWFKNNPSERRNIVLATKVFGGMDGASPNHNGLSRMNILDSVYASLERLGLDYVDIVYFHGFDRVVPVEESLSAIEDLVRQDLVRYFGASNFTLDQIAAYKAVERMLSVRCRMCVVQNQYDIIHGERSQPGVLEQAVREGYSYVPWSPMARGLLTDRYLDLSKIGPGDRLYDEGSLHNDLTPSVTNKLQQLAELARSWGMELSQLVIAYMLTIPGMGTLIPSSSTVSQLESNAAAGKIQLEDGQILRIKQVLGESTG